MGRGAVKIQLCIANVIEFEALLFTLKCAKNYTMI